MKTHLKAIIQRPQDLILAVADRDVLPATDTLVTQIVSAGAWSVAFNIIGESHRVCLRYGGEFILEEMLACVDLSAGLDLYQQDFRELQDHQYVTPAYQVAVQISTTPLDWRPSPDEIHYTFPQIASHNPETRIQWQVSDSAIHWRTLHTYFLDATPYTIYSDSSYRFQLEDTP